jgi:hypothetical protein
MVIRKLERTPAGWESPHGRFCAPVESAKSPLRIQRTNISASTLETATAVLFETVPNFLTKRCLSTARS